MLSEESFLNLAKVAIAETIHSPERAQAMVAKLSEREERFTAWVRAAQADGKLQAGDPTFMAHLLMGQLKTFAFWPQITMGRAPLPAAEQEAIIAVAVDMFLRYYAAQVQI
jgi:TetR/AcrR family transcriptional regulator, regulator of autoinduction and epiphytic fitness